MREGRAISRDPTGDRVLAAALKLFDEAGYSATGIEDIRLQAEVSIGSIYHRYGSKEGIAGALYLRALRDFQRGLLHALSAADGAEAGVRAAVGHHLRWVESDPPRARLLLRRRETEIAPANRTELERANRATFRAVAEWYGPHAEAGTLRELSPTVAYAVWFGPAQEYARRELEAPRPPRLAEAEPALSDAAWAALRSSR